MRRVVLMLLLGTFGCASAPAVDVPDAAPETATFAPELDVNLGEMMRHSSGLYYLDLRVGDGGLARHGSVVEVRYVGFLPDGRLFDAVRQEDRPLLFELGKGAVIRGWDEGISGMRVGGVRRLVVPARMGYGRRAPDPMLANTVLVFDIELVSVR